MISMPYRVVLCLALVVGAVLAGSPAAHAIPGVLRAVPAADIRVFDPNFSQANVTNVFNFHIRDTLFAPDHEGAPQPEMVESYETSPDGLSYTFVLREGLAFHDGSPVTARDVVASLKRWGQRALGKELMGYTTSLEAVNDKTVSLRLSKPWGLVVDSMAVFQGYIPFIFPEKLAMTDPKEQIRDTMGSGPFIFVESEWISGNKMVFKRNPNYVGRKEPPNYLAGNREAKVDRLEFRILTERATAQAALLTDEIDVLEDPDQDLVQTLKGHPDIELGLQDPTGRVGYIAVNHLYPPFNHPKARQALLWMVNQDEFLRAWAKDYTVCYAVFTCGGVYKNDANTGAIRTKDIGKAKQLLKEAGYNGEQVILLISTSQPHLYREGQVLTAVLREAGVNVRPLEMDFNTAVARRNSNDAPTADGRQGWHLFGTASRTVSWMNPPLQRSLDGSGTYFGWAKDDRINALKEKMAFSNDMAQKKQWAAELQSAVYDTVPFVWIGEYRTIAAWRKNVKNLVRSPIPVYWGASVE